MALEKKVIIENALLELGEMGSYNDDRSEVWKRAEVQLDKVLRLMAVDTAFRFNAITMKLTKTGRTSPRSENQFNKPIDFLSLIQDCSAANPRLENEYFYAFKDEIILEYCRTIDILEYPQYMEDVVTAKLMVLLASTINSYNDRLPYSLEKARQSMADVEVLEGFTKARETETIFEDKEYGRRGWSDNGYRDPEELVLSGKS